MIRSTKTSLQFGNKHRKDNLKKVVDEYRRVVGLFVDIFWGMEKVMALAPKETTSSIDTWLSARMRQAAAKQASGIVRGTRKKHEQRLYVLKKLKKKESQKSAEKVQKIIDANPISKPNCENIEPELDSRFVSVDWDNETSFDGWLTLSSLGCDKIQIPIKKTKHFNKLLSKGEIKNGVRLSLSKATFMFDIEEPKSVPGRVIGVDLGLNNLFTASDGQMASSDKHGWTLDKIISRLARRQKGSAGFRQAQSHRTNFINYSVNRLNLNGVNELRRENLHDMRRGKQSSRKLSHWTYTDIMAKLDRYCEEHGVRVSLVEPAYTSQKCSKCGTVRKDNRNGAKYECKCGNVMHADLNAAINIASEELIVPISHIHQ